MQDDLTIPDWLRRPLTPESQARMAAINQEYCNPHLKLTQPNGKINTWLKPKGMSEAEWQQLQERKKIERKEAEVQRAIKKKAALEKEKIALETRRLLKLNPDHLRWDSRHAKWISDEPITQEEEMAHDGTYSSRAAARKGAKRAGLESFTIVEVDGRFKYVTSTDVMTAAADAAPAAVTETPDAVTEEKAPMAKKKRAGKNGGPTKIESVIALCERKSGCTLTDIKEKVGVKNLAAAASLIGDVRRVRKSLKREKNGDGVSTYYL